MNEDFLVVLLGLGAVLLLLLLRMGVSRGPGEVSRSASTLPRPTHIPRRPERASRGVVDWLSPDAYLGNDEDAHR